MRAAGEHLLHRGQRGDRARAGGRHRTRRVAEGEHVLQLFPGEAPDLREGLSAEAVEHRPEEGIPRAVGVDRPDVEGRLAPAQLPEPEERPLRAQRDEREGRARLQELLGAAFEVGFAGEPA